MTVSESHEIVLPAIGVLVALWSAGLSTYLIVSERRRERSSMKAITFAFARQLQRLGGIKA